MSDPPNTRGCTGDHRVGDKVRMRDAVHAGARGVVAAVVGEELAVTLADGSTVCAAGGELTNYSLAARRAWQVMPKRTGRPRGGSGKKMVSFRLDRDVVEMLARARSGGHLGNASEAVNGWLRERLLDLLDE